MSLTFQKMIDLGIAAGAGTPDAQASHLSLPSATHSAQHSVCGRRATAKLKSGANKNIPKEAPSTGKQVICMCNEHVSLSFKTMPLYMPMLASCTTACSHGWKSSSFRVQRCMERCSPDLRVDRPKPRPTPPKVSECAGATPGVSGRIRKQSPFGVG